MRIGIASNGYPEKRCITENKSHDFINFDKSNTFKYINFLNSKLLNKAPSFIFRPLIVNPSNNIDAFHFFNHTGLLKASGFQPLRLLSENTGSNGYP